MNTERLLYSLPSVLIALVLHEYAHAFTAWKLGDQTPVQTGRLTLNPLKHLDPVGFAFLLLAGFGWARPVIFDPRQLRHPQRDRALIALAGPLTNLVLGFLGIGILKILLTSGAVPQYGDPGYLFTLLLYFSAINLGLFLFNILPIPPLDGSHVLLHGLNLAPQTEMKIYRYGSLVLFTLLFLDQILELNILPIGDMVLKTINFFLF